MNKDFVANRSVNHNTFPCMATEVLINLGSIFIKWSHCKVRFKVFDLIFFVIDCVFLLSKCWNWRDWNSLSGLYLPLLQMVKFFLAKSETHLLNSIFSKPFKLINLLTLHNFSIDRKVCVCNYNFLFPILLLFLFNG